MHIPVLNNHMFLMTPGPDSLGLAHFPLSGWKLWAWSLGTRAGKPDSPLLVNSWGHLTCVLTTQAWKCDLNFKFCIRIVFGNDVLAGEGRRTLKENDIFVCWELTQDTAYGCWQSIWSQDFPQTLPRQTPFPAGCQEGPVNHIIYRLELISITSQGITG